MESTIELTNSKNTLKLPEEEEEKPLCNSQYQDAEANFGIGKKAQPLAWYFKISWILSDIVTPSAPIVSIVYFGAIYRGGPLGVSSVNVHILNFVFVLIDQLVCARPVKLLHIVTPVAFSAIYTVFNLVYWLFDRVEHVLYRGVIDWNDPGLSLRSIAFMSFILLSLVIIFWFLLYRLKLWLFSKLYGRI
ncbi:protein rolling stone [Plakobranchus ocellatus]|uniref:Protein rolling stone n=1 Tax=Plakobranchus ocellatus TaxID=259542 RepID=A0AAV3YZH7_9GAST|nr:protein rolling stone [Plakobranchus ocellatus]